MAQNTYCLTEKEKNKMREVLILDLDSTIIDTSKSIINLHNKLSDKKIIYTPNHDWNWYPMIKTKEELSELFKLFDHKDFYGETLVVFDNAVEIINDLSMRYRIIIASKHDMIRRSITREWIYKTFPNTELVFLDSFDKSCVAKNIFMDKCLCFLDDKPEALISMMGLVAYIVSFNTYQWNSDWSGYRVNSWLEFKQFIANLEKLDE
jgi:5'(3')-deoxyribonucleotidase